MLKITLTKIEDKRILKLRRKIAALNGRKGSAFDVPEEGVYESYEAPTGLEGQRRLLTYFDCSIGSLRKFTALLDTNRGYYRLSHIVEVTRDFTPGKEYVNITIISPEALRNVKVFGFKIFDPGARCIKVSVIPFDSPINMKPGDTISVPWHISPKE